MEQLLESFAMALAAAAVSATNAASTGANATSAFANLHSVGVCRGSFSPALAAAWHAWDETHGSENDCVDAFPEDQLYW